MASKDTVENTPRSVKPEKDMYDTYIEDCRQIFRAYLRSEGKAIEPRYMSTIETLTTFDNTACRFQMENIVKTCYSNFDHLAATFIAYTLFQARVRVMLVEELQAYNEELKRQLKNSDIVVGLLKVKLKASNDKNKNAGGANQQPVITNKEPQITLENPEKENNQHQNSERKFKAPGFDSNQLMSKILGILSQVFRFENCDHVKLNALIKSTIEDIQPNIRELIRDESRECKTDDRVKPTTGVEGLIHTNNFETHIEQGVKKLGAEYKAHFYLICLKLFSGIFRTYIKELRAYHIGVIDQYKKENAKYKEQPHASDKEKELRDKVKEFEEILSDLSKQKIELNKKLKDFETIEKKLTRENSKLSQKLKELEDEIFTIRQQSNEKHDEKLRQLNAAHKETRSRLVSKLTATQKELEDSKKSFDELKQKNDAIDRRITYLEGRPDDNKEKLDVLRRKHKVLQKEHAKHEKTAQDIVERLTQQIAGLEENLQETTSQLQEEKKKHQKLLRKNRQVNQQLTEISQEHKTTSDELRKVRTQHHELLVKNEEVNRQLTEKSQEHKTTSDELAKEKRQCLELQGKNERLQLEIERLKQQQVGLKENSQKPSPMPASSSNQSDGHHHAEFKVDRHIPPNNSMAHYGTVIHTTQSTPPHHPCPSHQPQQNWQPSRSAPPPHAGFFQNNGPPQYNGVYPAQGQLPVPVVAAGLPPVIANPRNFPPLNGVNQFGIFGGPQRPPTVHSYPVLNQGQQVYQQPQFPNQGGYGYSMNNSTF